jgi:threonine synthase
VLIDPHTAVAVAGAGRAPKVAADGPSGAPPLIIVSTAHPAKFPEAVRAAAGVAPPMPAAARGLAKRKERIDRLPADIEAVKAYIRDFAGV